MTITLKKQSVIDQWGTVVEHAAGREKWVLDTTENLIQEAKIPGLVVRQDQVTMGMFGTKRNFVAIGFQSLKEYNMFIGARDFGMHLVYRSTVFWTPSDLKLSCSRQGTLLLVSHLGGCFVSMPPNQPGLIVLTLKLVQRQAEFFHRIKGLEP